MAQANDQGVRKRRVFYIPGYDPFPARRYRELYRSESLAQAEISNYQIALTSNPANRAHSWDVEAVTGDQCTRTRVEVLVWSDIVAASMRHSIVASYWHLICTIFIYFRTGAIFRMMRMRKGPVIAAFYPVAFMMSQLALALLVGWLCLTLFASVHPTVGMFAGVIAFVGSMQLFRRLDRRIYAHYLMQDYAFSARDWGAYPSECLAEN